MLSELQSPSNSLFAELKRQCPCNITLTLRVRSFMWHTWVCIWKLLDSFYLLNVSSRVTAHTNVGQWGLHKIDSTLTVQVVMKMFSIISPFCPVRLYLYKASHLAESWRWRVCEDHWIPRLVLVMCCVSAWQSSASKRFRFSKHQICRSCLYLM